MTTEMTPLDILLQAAANADAVRLASLVANAADAGVTRFNRPYLTDAWSQRWRHHLRLPGARRPEQRVNRNVPVLIGVDAITSVAGPDFAVSDPDILAFLAGRVYLAESLDVQAPTSNTLPVGEQTRAQAAALLSVREPGAANGLGDLTVSATAVRGGRGTAAADMTLSATAEVIKGG